MSTLRDKARFESALTNPYEVQVGQVWESCDRRDNGRRIRVIDIDGAYAVVESTQVRRIRLDRFNDSSTGYRLVKQTDH
jgi:hypothetical protein